MHSCPPYRVTGLSQDLVLPCVPPPQLTEQSLQLPNEPQPPSTAKGVFYLKRLGLALLLYNNTVTRLTFTRLVLNELPGGHVSQDFLQSLLAQEDHRHPPNMA